MANCSKMAESKSMVSANGMGVGRGRKWDYKGHEETFGGDDYVHYLNCDDEFTGVCVCMSILSKLTL